MKSHFSCRASKGSSKIEFCAGMSFLSLTNVCLDSGSSDSTFSIKLKDDAILELCHLNRPGFCQHPLNLAFSFADFPLKLICKGSGTVHVAGFWYKDPTFNNDRSDAFTDNSVSVDDLIKNHDVSKKRTMNDVEIKNISDKDALANPSKKANKKKLIKSQPIDSEIATTNTQTTNQFIPGIANNAPTNLKKWKIKPNGNEGILNPDPRKVTKQSGVSLIDYVVGVGAEPKPGSKIKILYEGMYPNGHVFDSRVTRKNPLVFRKGTGQVIRGLDYGIEGMRVGGSREIYIPSALGYGKDGMDLIPGDQDLIFRVTLLGKE